MEKLQQPQQPIKKLLNNYVYDLVKECVESELNRKKAYLFIEVKGMMPEFKEWIK